MAGAVEPSLPVVVGYASSKARFFSMGSFLEMWGESPFRASEWGTLLVFLAGLRMWGLTTHELG